ncbi:MAG: ribosome-associated translation inhibitor RaiA [Gammaproteobacteria bacterium]|nr:ribosome-associated translation inhibitor RaiA [Gammaproteobacteria bacterium]
MEIHITGRNIEITPALKLFTEEKMEKLTHRHDTITSLQVTLHVENLDHAGEATAHVYGTEIHASAKSNDMYTTIDMLSEKLLTQLTKHKEKMTDHHQR